MLADYTKLLIVRHPIDRLISGYWDKMGLHVGNRDYIRLRQNVMRAAHPNADEQTIKFGVPRFQDFIEHEVMKKKTKDKHWRSYSSLCDPCAVHYDYVIKLESFEADIEPVLQILAAGNTSMEQHLRNMTAPKNKQSPETRSSNRILEMLNISLEVRNNIEHMYKLDMELFGYGFDNVHVQRSYGADVEMC